MIAADPIRSLVIGDGSIETPLAVEIVLAPTLDDWLLMELLGGEGTPERQEWVQRACARRGIALPDLI